MFTGLSRLQKNMPPARALSVTTAMAVAAAMLSTVRGQTCTGMADGTSCFFSQCFDGVCIGQDCFSAASRLNQPCQRPPPAPPSDTGGRCNAAGACVDPSQVVTPSPTVAPSHIPTHAPTSSPTVTPTTNNADFRQPRPQSCSGRPNQALCSHSDAPCAEARCIGGVCHTASPFSSMPDDAPCNNCTAAGCDIRTCTAGQCLGRAISCAGHAQGVTCSTGGCVIGQCDGSGGCAVGTSPDLKPVGSSCAYDDIASGSVTAGTCTSQGNCVASVAPTAAPISVAPTAVPVTPPSQTVVTTAAPVTVTGTLAPATAAPVSTSAPTNVLSAGLLPMSGHVLIRGVYVVAQLLEHI